MCSDLVTSFLSICIFSSDCVFLIWHLHSAYSFIHFHLFTNKKQEKKNHFVLLFISIDAISLLHQSFFLVWMFVISRNSNEKLFGNKVSLTLVCLENIKLCFGSCLLTILLLEIASSCSCHTSQIADPTCRFVYITLDRNNVWNLYSLLLFWLYRFWRTSQFT